jgi:hypothetical protein
LLYKTFPFQNRALVKSSSKWSLRLRTPPTVMSFLKPRNAALTSDTSLGRHVLHLSGVGLVVGCDFAGTVEEIGPEVPVGLRKKGERVAGFIHGCWSSPLFVRLQSFLLNFHFRTADSKEEGGAFAEYVVADAALVLSLPDRLTFGDAATIPVAAFTACQTLYESLKLPTPKTPSKEPVPVSFDCFSSKRKHRSKRHCML